MVGKLSADIIFQSTIQIYENLYNQELLTRKDIDSKISTRTTFLSAQLFLAIPQSKWIIDNFRQSNYLFYCFLSILIISMLIIVTQIIYYYGTFFRTKKNYSEVPLECIRMFHLYCAQEKLKYSDRNLRYSLLLEEELELVIFLKDSYQRCSFENMKINLKRGKNLIILDNLIILNLIILFINYYIMYIMIGGDLTWVLC